MKYKAIRSAAHNFGASFVSTLNYADNDHTMSRLARLAASTGDTEFSVDLLTGVAGPQSLATSEVRKAVRAHVADLPRMLGAQRIEIARLVEAKMVIRFQLQGTVARQGGRPPWTVPFECVVTVRDDRGMWHEGRVKDMWHVG
jgi:hypothetical protein